MIEVGLVLSFFGYGRIRQLWRGSADDVFHQV
jgi:hypothetical protein